MAFDALATSKPLLCFVLLVLLLGHRLPLCQARGLLWQRLVVRAAIGAAPSSDFLHARTECS
jgi:hypothetical protein